MTTSYFAVPYQVFFEDTMAYGTHHYLTNFRFQCVGRETLLFDVLPEIHPEVRVQLDELVLLTREGYTRNLAPVRLGEKVAILMTAEEVTRSTLRLCFRVVREDGQPVCCGYQTAVFVDRASYDVAPIPAALSEYINAHIELGEQLTEPSFAERCHIGGKHVKAIFTEAVCALGRRVATERAHPRIVSVDAPAVAATQPEPSPSSGAEQPLDDLRTTETFRASRRSRASGTFRPSGSFAEREPSRRSSVSTVAPPDFADLVIPAGGTAFLFPGQGSYDANALRELHDLLPHFEGYFEHADAVARRHFGHAFLPLVQGESLADHDRQLQLCPDLDQLGIFLTGVLLAEILEEKSVRPDVLVGHSFGELAALAAGGAFDVETGLETVAQRVLALRTLPADTGAMMALACPPERAYKLLDSLRLGALVVAVINHGKQVVLSGTRGDLARVEATAPGLGISATLLKSRYPFHSPLLQTAAEQFGAALRGLPFRAPRRQVYSPIEAAVYSAQTDFPQVLSSHFVRPFDFRDAIAAVRGAGCQSFVECGAGGVLVALVRKNLPDADPDVAMSPVSSDRSLEGGLLSMAAARSARKVRHTPRRSSAAKALAEIAQALVTEPAVSDESGGYPVAIVSLGCVLPGAANPETYWRNLRHGVSGITAPPLDHPDHFDFVGGDQVVPDKSYTMLHGDAGAFERDPRVPYSPDEYARLTRAQQLLANALAQCVSGLRGGAKADPSRTRCLFGSTADGIKEYDEALLIESLRRVVTTFDEPEALRGGFEAGLAQLPEIRSGDAGALAPYPGYRAVVERTLGAGVDTVLLDAACASSLYAVDLASRHLWNYDCDLVIAGGAFSPGPANGPLFAQFGGLATVDSFPFDERANGVIFGEGGAVLAFKRLPDALRDGDHVYGVVRAVGLSSDGKSPSVNVPRASGQALAVRRAYGACGIDRKTIQFVEAHATATPVGDATEFEALRGEFSDRDGQSPLYLESVKCLLGHTGWLAGASSIIKLCLSFEARTIAPQHNFVAPNPGIQLAGSPFTIPTSELPWPSNVGGAPRRAGISGFGFGGSNAHVVLEAFDADYHKRLAARVRRQPVRAPLAVVAAAGLFPSAAADGLSELPPATPAPIPRSALRLPTKKRLLPDVVDQMDATQFLALMGAEHVLNGVPNWGEHREEIAIALGLSGKVGRGVMATERIYADRLRRLLAEHRQLFALAEADFQRLASKLFDSIYRDNIPSNAYTLVGMMPNVATGRVANIFDINGPNLVVDAGGTSALEALRLAELWLAYGDAALVLAGGLKVSPRLHTARAQSNGVVEEGACVLAVTTPELAALHGWPVVALLSVGAPGDDRVVLRSPSAPVDRAASEMVVGATPREIAGLGELARAVRAASQGDSAALRWQSGAAASTPAERALGDTASISAEPERVDEVGFYSPALFPAPAVETNGGAPLPRILFLTPDAAAWTHLVTADGFDLTPHRVLTPSTFPVPGAASVDLTADETARATLATIDLGRFDAVVAVRDLSGVRGEALLGQSAERDALTDLLFLVGREAYDRVRSGNLALAALTLGAWSGARLNPETGLYAGFIKSVARELRESVVTCVNTDATRLSTALRQLGHELREKGSAEVFYRYGRRHVHKLVPLAHATRDRAPYLTAESVVVATGGGRGVTALMCEELLERFHCTVVMFGRTDLSRVPRHVLEMDDDALAAYESQFYREELARRPGSKIIEHKRAYERLQAAHEIHSTMRRLAKLRGHVEYVPLDVTDAAAVDREIVRIVAERGGIDLVVHGAGVQTSVLLNKRKLTDWRRTLDTKLAGLRNLHTASRRHVKDGRPVHFHILTSAFSYFGNDGQPDYGAANEAMNRLADFLGAAGAEHWTTLAWLAWDGVGMTRGSEYSALAKERNPYPLRATVGREIFARLIAGRATAPSNILMTPREQRSLAIVMATPDEQTAIVRREPVRERRVSRQWILTVESLPYLLEHIVSGTPTLPGTFEIELAAQAARELRPDRSLVAAENATFQRFLRVPMDRQVNLRGEATIVSEDEVESLVHVRLLSDFVHKSGQVLQKDIVHFEVDARLATATVPLRGPCERWERFDGRPAFDPYIAPGSPVHLGGLFSCLDDIVIGPERRRARFRLPATAYHGAMRDFITPPVLLDAMLRFGSLAPEGESPSAVFVPEQGAKIRLQPGVNDVTIDAAQEDVYLVATNPHMEGDAVLSRWVQAMDGRGRTLVVTEAGVGRRMEGLRIRV